jgi:hypothetical protein
MPSKSKVPKIAKVALDEIVKPVVKEVVKEVKPMPAESVRMLYGDFGQELPNEEQLENKKDLHRIQDAQKLQDARQMHAAILGETKKPPDAMSSRSTKEEQPVLNPFSGNKKTSDVSSEVIQRAVWRQFESVQNPENQNPDKEKEDDDKRKALLEQEKAIEKTKEQQMLNLHVEAPKGRKTGSRFNRKSNITRMQIRQSQTSAEAGKRIRIGG